MKEYKMNKGNLTIVALIATFAFAIGVFWYEGYYTEKYNNGIRPGELSRAEEMEIKRKYLDRKWEAGIDVSRYNVEMYSSHKDYLGDESTRQEILVKNIKLIYDDLIAHNSELDENDRVLLKDEIDKLISEISEISNMEVYKKLLYLNGKIPGKYSRLEIDLGVSKSYPVKLKWYGDEIFVEDAMKDYKELIGFKLLGVNNFTKEQVIEKINQLISGVNEKEKKYTNLNSFNFYSFKWSGILDENDEANFKFTDGNEEKIIKMGLGDISKLEIPRYNTNNFDNIPKIKDKSVYKTIWSKRDDDIFYVRFDKIIDADSAAKYEAHLKFNYSNRLKILNDIQESIGEKSSVDKLVFDLRSTVMKAPWILNEYITGISSMVDGGTETYIIIDKNVSPELIIEIAGLDNIKSIKAVGELPELSYYDGNYKKHEYKMNSDIAVMVSRVLNTETGKVDELKLYREIPENKKSYIKKIDNVYNQLKK